MASIATGRKISVQKKPAELQNACIEKITNSLQRSMNDYAGGGALMENGQVFGSFHQPMVFLDRKVKNLKIVLSQKTSKDSEGKDFKIIVVTGTVDFQKSRNELSESLQVFTREYTITKCKELDVNGILFAWVGVANEKLESILHSKDEKNSRPALEPLVRTAPGAAQ